MSRLKIYVLSLTLLLGAFNFALPSSSHAVTVAFLEMRHPEGDVVKLEPNGQFAHVALKLNDGWLHAYPGRGVELRPSLYDIADHVTDIVYLTLDGAKPPADNLVKFWLGKPFDPSYRWNVQTSTYCTRLIADLLNIDPKPMKFSEARWRQASHYAFSDPGLSPDDLYQALQDRGFEISGNPGCAAPLTFAGIGVKYARTEAKISKQEARDLGLERDPIK